MARTEEIEVLREVAAAVNCLTSMEENKMEICDRSISTIIAMLLSGDTEVERHSCCAIANLMENVDLHERLLNERGLSPLVALALSDDLNTKGEASRAIANLAANVDVQQVSWTSIVAPHRRRLPHDHALTAPGSRDCSVLDLDQRRRAGSDGRRREQR